MPAFDLLTDYTIQNVAIGAALLGLNAGVIGAFAVLRKQALLGDTLSHAALPGICMGFIIAGAREMESILAGALVTCVAAALLVVLLIRTSRLKTDAALGISLSLFFAVGVVLLTYIQGSGNAAQSGLDTFLFGQAAAILRTDLRIMAGITLFGFLIVFALWKEFKLVSFDPEFAAAVGLPVLLLDIALTMMVALAVVVGLQMVGVILMAAMIVAPAVAARQWTRRLEGMVALSAAFGVISGMFGAVISATGRGLATGPIIVLSISAIAFLSLLVAPERGLLWEMAVRFRQRWKLAQLQALTSLSKQAASGGRHNPSYRDAISAVSLRRLAARGLLRRSHRESDGQSGWELTEAGCAELRRITSEIRVNP